jgi:anti-sigma factor ChrR (cupin superfamily)
MTHLTEEERQSAADGSLDPKRMAAATAHMTDCAECREDVARLHGLVARMKHATAGTHAPDDLWPEIRARIEREKVVHLPGAAHASSSRTRWIVVSALAAALVAIGWLSLRRAPSAERRDPQSLAIELTAVSDSLNRYQEQIADLQSDLQLSRAFMRTETAAAIDHDLAICDQAIAELNEAAKRAPNNLEIRQLLAASYRRKLDVLKRVDNAS